MRFQLIIIALPVLIYSVNCTPSQRNKKNGKPRHEKTKHISIKYDSITLTDKGLKGYFKGPEYTEEGDIAHQFSNTVAKKVGHYLKERYKKKVYLKIDLSGIKITTQGLDQLDDVIYTLKMPFQRVSKCEAYTGIEHCGSWDHQEKRLLNERFKELKKGLQTEYSIGPMEHQFYTTSEGFQEYWIQFKHKEYQFDCGNK